MKAYIATGNTETPVELQDVPEPTTRAGHAIIQVDALSLNRGELTGIQSAGSRPGWDIAGVVLESDPEGSGPAAGTRVAAVVREGGWAEKVSVPVGQLGQLPEHVSPEGGSTLGIAGLTALRALRAAGPLDGKRVLVTGASGAVGRFAIQIASLHSADVTALVSKPEQRQTAHEMGASTVVVSGEELPGLYDIVIDGVGGPALESAIRSAAPGAKILTYGIASGRPANIKFADFRNGPGSALQGFFIWQSDLSSFGNDLTYLAELVAKGDLKAHVAAKFDWSELNDGLEALVRREAAGKIVVSVN